MDANKVPIPPQDAEAIRQWARNHPADLRIDLVRVPGHPALPAIEAFARGLSDLAPSLRIRRETNEDQPRPGLRLRPNLVFHAAPSGTEVKAFLEALSLVADPAPPSFPADQTAFLERIGAPAQLELYIGPHCPFCPAMVVRLAALAAAVPPVALAVIDAGLFDRSARDHGIQSVPTLVLDGGLRWTGQVGFEVLLPALADRDPARLPPAALERMLESGGAADLAAMMAAAGAVFPALADLVLHPRWSVRLGAMVTAETLADMDARLALGIADPLLARYAGQPVNVRGDALQVLGMVGDETTVSQIAELTGNETDPEVRAAADEAIAAILERRTA